MFTTRVRRRLLSAAAFTGAAMLALTGCAGGGGGGEAAYDPDEEVTLTFTWWGNDDRAQRYQQLIDAFEEEHPNITIEGNFTDFPSYWEKRQTEAAGGGLPDVWQFSDSYLREYAEPGLLLDLEHGGRLHRLRRVRRGAAADRPARRRAVLAADGLQRVGGVPQRRALEQAGVEPYEGGTSTEEYTDWMKSVTDATGGTVYGGTDMTQRIQTFENVLRAQGGNLYTEDGELGFTEDELRDFWNSGAEARDGVTVPQQRLEEVYPKSGFGVEPHRERGELEQLPRRLPRRLRRRDRHARRAAHRRAGREGPLPPGGPPGGDLGEDRAPRGMPRSGSTSS